MNIAINTRFLIKNKLEGIGWFTKEIFSSIVQHHPEHRFYFLFDRPYHSEFLFSDNVIPLLVNPPARHPLLFYIWFEYSIPRILKKINANIFISPDGFLSLSAKVPQVLVLHDIAYTHFTEHLSFSQKWYYTHFTPLFAKKAKKIITVSEFSKKDIVEKLDIEPEKICVSYNGVNTTFHPLNTDEKDETCKKHTNGKKYFLFVGAIQPRKNLDTLLLSYDKFREVTQKDYKLLIVGRKSWGYDSIFNIYKSMKYKEDVIFTGHLESAELNKVYSSAIGLMFVSKFEGFGIPIIEAFACECPVVISNVCSMPEVAGDAALIVNPNSVEEITSAMIKLCDDEKLRYELIVKGRERLKIFSWENSAEKIWAQIEKVLCEK